jgi:hypothetical protein
MQGNNRDVRFLKQKQVVSILFDSNMPPTFIRQDEPLDIANHIRRMVQKWKGDDFLLGLLWQSEK